MATRTRLDQGKHNEKVCNYLTKRPEYSDWVVTTAFYSAKYYLESKIFPIKIKKRSKVYKIKNFNEYLTFYGDFRRKHHKFLELVENKCLEVADAYHRLHDSSFNARYNMYVYTRKLSKVARDDLLEIKEYCI